MVSLNRARECIGRRVEHCDDAKVKGHVEKVDSYDVWVREADGSLTPCIPENIQWVSVLTPDLIDAIQSGDHYEDAQCFFTPFVFADDCDDHMGYDDILPGLAVVGSSATANDDDKNHPLYVIAHGMKQVYRVRVNAAPDGAWQIEELLGWAEA